MNLAETEPRLCLPQVPSRVQGSQRTRGCHRARDDATSPGRRAGKKEAVSGFGQSPSLHACTSLSSRCKPRTPASMWPRYPRTPGRTLHGSEVTITLLLPSTRGGDWNRCRYSVRVSRKGFTGVGGRELVSMLEDAVNRSQLKPGDVCAWGVVILFLALVFTLESRRAKSAFYRCCHPALWDCCIQPLVPSEEGRPPLSPPPATATTHVSFAAVSVNQDGRQSPARSCLLGGKSVPFPTFSSLYKIPGGTVLACGLF